MGDAQLELDGLGVSYPGRRRRDAAYAALTDVDLAVGAGEAFGVVGESGAGKSTLARCVVGVQRPTGGTILFAGRPLDPRHDREQRRAIQMVFQDPFASLNPRMTVGAAMIELLRFHDLARGRADARRAAAAQLERVGLPDTALDLRPHAFSGGQRQRIAIARALLLRPRLLVADEPVSALDVSVQASILMLLKEVQRDLGLTVLFVSHDLAVVHQFCDRVAVMQYGRVVETGAVGALFSQPRHSYTRALLAAATDLPPLEVSVPATGPPKED